MTTINMINMLKQLNDSEQAFLIVTGKILLYKKKLLTLEKDTYATKTLEAFYDVLSLND